MQGRNGALDVLRIAACLAVILLHSAAGYVYKFNQVPLWEWQLGNFLDSATRWCVPVFVLLSGALNISVANKEGAPFFRKRFTRLLPVIIFWTAAYVYYTGMMDPAFVLHNILSGYPYYHLYFLFLIAGLYFMTPAFTAYAEAVGEERFRKTGICCLVFTIIAMTISAPVFNAMTLALPFVGYYLLGKSLSRKPIPLKIAVTGLIASILFTTIVTWLLVEKHGITVSGIWLYDFWTPNVAVMAICVFSIFARLKIQQTPVLTYVSGVTLGVYLVHVMVLETLQKAMVNQDLVFSAPLTIAIHFVGTAAISFAFAVIMGKVPIIRRVFS